MTDWQPAYDDGGTAACAGLPANANPYPWQSVDWYAWETGYSSVIAELDKVCKPMEQSIAELFNTI